MMTAPIVWLFPTFTQLKKIAAGDIFPSLTRLKTYGCESICQLSELTPVIIAILKKVGGD